MQARECEFRLASGRKCRAAANRNQPFCRHHAPAPPPPRIPKSERYSSLARWRQLGSDIPSMPLEVIPYTVWDLLQCLVDRGPNSTGTISDLTVGRFLRALVNRFGDVPFPNPELAVPENPAPSPAAPVPGPAAPLAALSPEISALLESLALPPLPGLQPVPSRAPVSQSRV
jgi:hypothetical protein